MKKYLIEDIIKRDGFFASTSVGISMFPMLRNRKDSLVIVPYEGRLKKYDVPLYKTHGKYVLHRIIEVTPDSYVIRGDNCLEKEYGVTDEQMVGVLKSFTRNGKEISVENPIYRIYVWVWCHSFGIRKVFKKIYWKLKRWIKKH